MVLSIYDTLTLAIDLVKDLIPRTATFVHTAEDRESILNIDFELARFRRLPSFAIHLLSIALVVLVFALAESPIVV